MSYGRSEAAELILKACRELKENNLIIRTWGNISTRLSSELMLITPSGMDYDRLGIEDLVCVNINTLSAEDSKTPSSESGVHAVCYREREDVNFVIHTHQPYASALSVIGNDIKLGDRVSDKVKGLLGPVIACAQYGPNGSRKLNNAVLQCLALHPENSHLLMKNHGALCLGTDYENAFDIAYTLEALSKKAFERYIDSETIPLTEQIRRFKLEETSVPGEPDEEPVRPVQTVAESVDREHEQVGQWILHVRTPYILIMSEFDSTMKAYLDDIAQIAGPAIKCVSAGESHKTVMKAMGANNAVLVEKDGAYCTGESYDEALCVAQVLEKGCMAAYLGKLRGVKPISFLSARKDRSTYVNKYSKLK